MSLINEALKKAQRQRTGENPSLSSLPSVGGETPAKIAKRDTPGLSAVLLRAGLGVGALAILIIGGFIVFRSKDTAAPVPVAVAPTLAPAPAPAATTPAPAPTPTAPVATVSAPASTPALVQPAPVQTSTFVVPNVASSAPPATVTPEPTPTTAVVPVAARTPPVDAPVVETPKPEPARPAAPLKLEPRAINFIEGIRVAGIRASSTDSKVLMNDRVYRVGDTVEHEMGLKLVSITSSSLTFEDDRGAKYTRSF